MYKNIKLIRLDSGEDLIGIVMEYEHKGIVVDRPLSMQMLTNGIAEKLVLVPYLPFSINTVCVINQDKVITIADIHPVLQKYYLLCLEYVFKDDSPVLEKIDFHNRLMEFEKAMDDIGRHLIHEPSDALN